MYVLHLTNWTPPSRTLEILLGILEDAFSPDDTMLYLTSSTHLTVAA